MKTVFVLLATIFPGVFLHAQHTNPRYDSTLAKRLGGDEYGMKKYVFVILRTGPNGTTDKRFIDSCFAGHMANIGRLVKDGKLIVAGPMGKNEKAYRGIFILNTASIGEARSLVGSDPAVNGRLLEAEYYDWYGSAALPEYLDASERISKKNH